MIHEITFETFRSYAHATLKLAPLTLLVGPNASGKSNAREGIQLLSWIAQGRRLDEILRSVRERELGMRGRFSDLGFRGADRVTLAVRLVEGAWTYTWRITLRVDATGLRVAEESLTTPQRNIPLYEVHQAAKGLQHDITVTYNNFKKGGKKPTIPGTDLQAVLTQIGTPAAFRREHAESQKVIPEAVERIRQELSNIVLLDPNPHMMRAETFVEDRVLRPDGANLSSVLYHLCQTEAGKQSVLEFLRKLPERDITDVDFLLSARQQVIAQVRETFVEGGELRDASVLSDGTLRVLAIAAAVLSAPKGSLVVIEEIDNGVHPSRARMLLENMHRVAKQRSLRLLITSHNPALANALPTESIPDMMYCYRDPATGATQLKRLRDLEGYSRLVAQGPIGELITREVLDRFVKNPQTEQSRREAALSWLDRLEDESTAGASE